MKKLKFIVIVDVIYFWSQYPSETRTTNTRKNSQKMTIDTAANNCSEEQTSNKKCPDNDGKLQYIPGHLLTKEIATAAINMPYK